MVGEDTVIIHYDEIFLKGKNRYTFEKILADNIKAKAKELIGDMRREPGQIVLEIAQNADAKKIKDIISKVPGIAHFSLAKKVLLSLEQIKKESIDILKDKQFETFKVDTARHHKENEFKSEELNRTIGELVLNKYSNKKVQMKNPDLILKIEISVKDAYISAEQIKGVGGMPTNQKQKVVALLSGGLDSPVAAYLMMKRGCEVILVHFQNENQMTQSVQGKIIQLSEQLSKYQQHTKLYIIPFEEIQKQIIMNVNSTLRMLVYRRFMLRIASEIATQEKAKFLIVGDSLSQVASQTFDNIGATYEAADKHVFSPVIGLDKKEIIAVARQIGTYEISSLPYGDCCSYFIPKHPELKSTTGLLRQQEEKFEMQKLIDDAVSKAKISEWK